MIRGFFFPWWNNIPSSLLGNPIRPKCFSFQSRIFPFIFASVNFWPHQQIGIFSVTLQLSQSLTCEGERGAKTAGVGVSGWERRPKQRDPEISAPGLYRARSEPAHQYSLTAPACVPGDRQNKVAEVTHFTSGRERETRGDRGSEWTMLGTIREGKFQAKWEQREAFPWRVETLAAGGS